MATEAPLTPQDVLNGLAKVAETNGDSFRLKLVRRPSAASSVTQHVGTFCDATWAMIANAESWIGAFSGGGLYVIHIFDGRDGRKQYGSVVPSEITGPAKTPDPRVTKASGWIGPTLIEAAVGANGAGAVAFGPQQFLGPEPQFPLSSAPRTQDEAGLRALFHSQQEDLRRRELELQEKAHRAELEGVRRVADERAQRLEAQINELKGLVKDVATKPSPPPGPSITDIVTGILSAVAPIATAVLTAQAEERRARAATEEARARVEAEERRAAAARPIIPPELLTILQGGAERAEKQAGEFASLMKAQAESSRINMESQAVAQRTMLQTIADIAQLQLKTGEGEGDKPGIDWGKLALGVMQGVAMMRQGQPGAVQGQPGMVTTQNLPSAVQRPAGAAPGPAPQGGAPAANGTVHPASDAPVPAAPELDAIEKRIRAHESPIEIADEIKKALELPTVKAEIAAEGSLSDVFGARLGDWAEAKQNERYMGALIDAFTKAGLLELVQ